MKETNYDLPRDCTVRPWPPVPCDTDTCEWRLWACLWFLAFGVTTAALSGLLVRERHRARLTEPGYSAGLSAGVELCAGAIANRTVSESR